MAPPDQFATPDTRANLVLLTLRGTKPFGPATSAQLKALSTCIVVAHGQLDLLAGGPVSPADMDKYIHKLAKAGVKPADVSSALADQEPELEFEIVRAIDGIYRAFDTFDVLPEYSIAPYGLCKAVAAAEDLPGVLSMLEALTEKAAEEEARAAEEEARAAEEEARARARAAEEEARARARAAEEEARLARLLDPIEKVRELFSSEWMLGPLEELEKACKRDHESGRTWYHPSAPGEPVTPQVLMEKLASPDPPLRWVASLPQWSQVGIACFDMGMPNCSSLRLLRPIFLEPGPTSARHRALNQLAAAVGKRGLVSRPVRWLASARGAGKTAGAIAFSAAAALCRAAAIRAGVATRPYAAIILTQPAACRVDADDPVAIPEFDESPAAFLSTAMWDSITKLGWATDARCTDVPRFPTTAEALAAVEATNPTGRPLVTFPDCMPRNGDLSVVVDEAARRFLRPDQRMEMNDMLQTMEAQQPASLFLCFTGSANLMRPIFRGDAEGLVALLKTNAQREDTVREALAIRKPGNPLIAWHSGKTVPLPSLAWVPFGQTQNLIESSRWTRPDEAIADDSDVYERIGMAANGNVRRIERAVNSADSWEDAVAIAEHATKASWVEVLKRTSRPLDEGLRFVLGAWLSVHPSPRGPVEDALEVVPLKKLLARTGLHLGKLTSSRQVNQVGLLRSSFYKSSQEVDAVVSRAVELGLVPGTEGDGEHLAVHLHSHQTWRELAGPKLLDMTTLPANVANALENPMKHETKPYGERWLAAECLAVAHQLVKDKPSCAATGMPAPADLLLAANKQVPWRDYEEDSPVREALIWDGRLKTGRRLLTSGLDAISHDQVLKEELDRGDADSFFHCFVSCEGQKVYVLLRVQDKAATKPLSPAASQPDTWALKLVNAVKAASSAKVATDARGAPQQSLRGALLERALDGDGCDSALVVHALVTTNLVNPRVSPTLEQSEGPGGKPVADLTVVVDIQDLENHGTGSVETWISDCRAHQAEHQPEQAGQPPASLTDVDGELVSGLFPGVDLVTGVRMLWKCRLEFGGLTKPGVVRGLKQLGAQYKPGDRKRRLENLLAQHLTDVEVSTSKSVWIAAEAASDTIPQIFTVGTRKEIERSHEDERRWHRQDA